MKNNSVNERDLAMFILGIAEAFNFLGKRTGIRVDETTESNVADMATVKACAILDGTYPDAKAVIDCSVDAAKQAIELYDARGCKDLLAQAIKDILGAEIKNGGGIN